MEIPQKNRRESYQSIHPTAQTRRDAILQILRDCGDMTAQEIACELHWRGLTPTDERNFAAPRLTELYEATKVWPAGSKICGRSGRSVTVWTAGKE